MKKKGLTQYDSDGSSFTVDPSQFTSQIAKRRHAASMRRRRLTTVDPDDAKFKATCPWCHATNVVMSPIDPSQPLVIEPMIGDAIQCDVCRRYHVVEQVNGGKVKTFPIEPATS